MLSAENSELKKADIQSKSKKRLWVVTELYYPEDNQTGYYLTRIAEGLAEDFEVKVICGQPNYAARGTRAPKREVHKGVEIHRVWGTTLDKDVLFFRLINMLTLGVSMFLKSLVEFEKNDKVLSVSAPPSLPFITALAAKLRRAFYTLVIQDKYPEILIAVGKAKPDSFFIKILDKMNGWLYGRAEKVIVVGRDMEKLVNSQIGANANQRNKVRVIQNWAALEEIEPTPRANNSLINELGLSGKFIFLYAGNMGHPQDLETIVKCAEDLKEDDRFHFLFIGSGVKRKWLEKRIEERLLVNVTLLAPRPRSEQKIFLNACDVGLVPLVEKMAGVAMPSRTYNILAAGKPILALIEKESEVAKVIEEDRVGWFVPPFEPDKLRLMIDKIYSERSQIAAMEKRARRAAVEKYSVEVAIEKYKKVFSETNARQASDNASE